MNAAVAQQIKINRENNARTLVADWDSMTGITSDGQHVEHSIAMVQWGWFNVDTGKRVEIGGKITWVTLNDEE